MASTLTYPESLIMDPVERTALAVAIAQAISTTPRPPLSATETAQRMVAIIGGAIGVAGVLVAAIGWAFRLQASVDSVAANMAEIKESTKELSAVVSTVSAEKWTRADQERFNATTIADLETRVRALEARPR